MDITAIMDICRISLITLSIYVANMDIIYWLVRSYSKREGVRNRGGKLGGGGISLF